MRQGAETYGFAHILPASRELPCTSVRCGKVSMKVKVKRFSAGCLSSSGERVGVVLAEGATVGELMEVLRKTKRDRAISSGLSVILVNRSRATAETGLKDGDEVLILEPLGGGS